jgi:hypothetical protein
MGLLLAAVHRCSIGQGAAISDLLISSRRSFM